MRGSAVIVGAGIGGLTAAHALQRIGWQVEIYEQAPEIRPVGAGIGIAPNAVKALDVLGLADDLRERGRRQEGLAIRGRSGRRLVHLAATASSGGTARRSTRCTGRSCTASCSAG